MRGEEATVARREDALLQGGAKLVVLREGEQHYLRLLVPKDGRATFVTPKIPLSYTDMVRLHDAPTYRIDFGGFSVRVEENRAIAVFDSLVMWGARRNLSTALEDIAR